MSYSNTNVAILVVAAGRGSRAGLSVPKQYYKLNDSNISVLESTLQPFVACKCVDLVLPVIHKDDVQYYEQIDTSSPKIHSPVFGGTTRTLSVLNGLEILAVYNPSYVLIHDGARPYISVQLIEKIITTLKANQFDGVLPVLEVIDTIHTLDKGQETIEKSLQRDRLVRAQTPQGFVFDKIFSAYQNISNSISAFTSDDTSLAVQAGLSISTIKGEETNKKMTLPHDFVSYNRKNRVGHGFDVHAFDTDQYVTTIRLCGIDIAHNQCLKGHSDADVGLHALTDALLGAIGEGDIGRHFPPSDMKWKNTDSRYFLRRARDIVRNKGGEIINADITLMCEAPKIGPYARQMSQEIANCLNLSVDAVNVKATTTENLGFTGRREGIAAMATASILL